MANSIYKPTVMPVELRVSTVGWETLLHQWEQQVLLLFKEDLLHRGLEFVSLAGFVTHLVNEDLRWKIYDEFVYDSFPFPAETEYERIEGERRLKEYRDRLRRLVEISGIELPANALALMRDSLRYHPAAEADIQAVESRLGICFPHSYREFLGTTNGWLIEQQPSISPVEKVVPLREVDPDYVQTWLEHKYLHEAGEAVVTPEPLGEGEAFVDRNLDIPTTCLNEALVIGMDEREKAFLLLDPTTVDERGEWRALWLFRYEFAIVGRDFARLMEILYRLNAQR